jgi:hypothetical protein
LRDGGRKIVDSRAAQAKLGRPYLKNKRAGKEHLPSMCKALYSTPSTENNNNSNNSGNSSNNKFL